MPFSVFPSPMWSPLRMRTKVVSFFRFSKSFQTKNIKAVWSKITTIASSGSYPKGNQLIRGYFLQKSYMLWKLYTNVNNWSARSPEENVEGAAEMTEHWRWIFSFFSSFIKTTFMIRMFQSTIGQAASFRQIRKDSRWCDVVSISLSSWGYLKQFFLIGGEHFEL